MIRPRLVAPLPLTEACRRISRTSLFSQPFPAQEGVRRDDRVAEADTAPDSDRTAPRRNCGVGCGLRRLSHLNTKRSTSET